MPRGSVVTSPIASRCSDHYAVRAALVCERVERPPRTRLARQYSHSNRMAFSAAMISVDWDEILNEKYPDTELKSYIETFAIQYDRAVKAQKVRHYESFICNSSNSHKAIWRVVNTERGANTRTSASFTDVAKDSTGKSVSSRVSSFQPRARRRRRTPSAATQHATAV
ncbi:Uncharacterized protein OBRU01_02968 [Operophtera brumata]|uniref:Uncharacterized protein n=1 Tax=Operophtera brumata TaxID=104452 RepID=A0A0L7LDC5_OPEBR|nr:Uncharacterized protein OBRU01_02968 [Operophtera brumata]